MSLAQAMEQLSLGVPELMDLPPETKQHILRYLSVKQLVQLLPVCFDLNQQALAALARAKYLGPYNIRMKYLKLLLPKLGKLSHIEAKAFHESCFTSNTERPKLITLLAKCCPNIEHIADSKADPAFILQYTQELEKKGRRVKIKKITLKVSDALPPALMTLLHRYRHIKIDVVDKSGVFVVKVVEEDMPSGDLQLITSRTTILRTNFKPATHTLEDAYIFLHSLANLRVLKLECSVSYVTPIGECCPRLKHLRLNIVKNGNALQVEHLRHFISDQVSRYASFGLEIVVNETQAMELTNLLVNANARFSSFGDALFQANLVFGPDWNVVLSSHLTINSWPSDAADSLFRLFPPTPKVIIRSLLDNVALFLKNLGHVNVLSIHISVKKVLLISDHCPFLTHLAIHDWKKYDESKFEKLFNNLKTFIPETVKNYESFSLSMKETIPDDDARLLANLLKQSRAKFHNSEELGPAQLKLGPRWNFKTSRIYCTVFAWPKKDVDLFVALIRPAKEVIISHAMLPAARATLSELLRQKRIKVSE